MRKVSTLYQAGLGGLVQVGRLLRSPAPRFLECYRPDGDLTLGSPLVLEAAGPPPAALPPLSPLLPEVLEYRRAGMASWRVLELDPAGSATMDAHALTPEELQLVLENVDRGVAEVRHRELAKTESDSDVDLSTDPTTGLQNLLALDTAAPPLLYLGLVEYDATWDRSPAGAQELARVVADALRGHSAFRLVGGRFAVEVESEQAGVQVAQELRRELDRAAAAGKLGLRGEVRADVLPAWAPSGGTEGLLVGGVLVRL